MIPLGLEPKTVCLEGRCSIQLSYEPRGRAFAADGAKMQLELH